MALAAVEIGDRRIGQLCGGCHLTWGTLMVAQTQVVPVERGEQRTWWQMGGGGVDRT